MSSFWEQTGLKKKKSAVACPERCGRRAGAKSRAARRQRRTAQRKGVNAGRRRRRDNGRTVTRGLVEMALLYREWEQDNPSPRINGLINASSIRLLNDRCFTDSQQCATKVAHTNESPEVTETQQYSQGAETQQ
eukprot:3434986-Pyramimonas_sp.AAC.1